MFTESYSTTEFHKGQRVDQCLCNNENEIYRIIENYRSILDRKQPFLSSWKVCTNDEKVHFTPGNHRRRDTNALLIQSNYTSFINPWYEYVHVNQHLLSLIKPNHCSQIFELVLLENNASVGSRQFTLAIIECPCLRKLGAYCTYCRLVLTVAKQSEASPPLERRHKETPMHRDSAGLYNPQRSIPILSQSIETLQAMNTADRNLLQMLPQGLDDQSIVLLHNEDDDRQPSSLPNDDYYSVHSSASIHFLSQNMSSASHYSLHTPSFPTTTQHVAKETQTKLFAILLPQSPLSEMTGSNIEGRTLLSTTRTCQVNTLSYLIKPNDYSMEVRCPIMDDRLSPPMDRLSTTLTLFHDKNQLNRPDEDTHAVHQIKVPTGRFKSDKRSSERNVVSSTPLKCVNACGIVDFNGLAALMRTSSLRDAPVLSGLNDKQHAQNVHVNRSKHRGTTPLDYVTVHNIPNKNNNSRDSYPWVIYQRRRRRDKKRLYAFLHRLRCRKKFPIVQTSVPEQIHPTLVGSMTHQSAMRWHSTQANVTEHKSPSQIRGKCSHHSYLTTPTSLSQYKAHDYLIIARTSKNSIYCSQLRTLLNNHESALGELIDFQLIVAATDNYRSVCILLDDAKQPEHDRSTFLRYIHRSLAKTLKKIVENNALNVKCMSLAFFNNSMCDLGKMQRLRLIDTGRTILLRPSCETDLRTSEDIDLAIGRLSAKMLFAHQMFIANFYDASTTSLSSSFLFLHLAPICSVPSTGLLTNLNSTTYSVLNLIRQLRHGQSLNHHSAKWCRLNDYAVSRVLKSYLLSSPQTLTVLTAKPQQGEQLSNTLNSFENDRVY